MLCNKCKKRPAIVFVQRMENGEMKNEGYCLSCARELGIKPLDDIMKQFGISGEDLEAMEDRFAGKPILNISASETCNTLVVLKRYPLCFQCFSWPEETSVVAKELVNFCQREKGNAIPWSEIEVLYDDLKLDQIARNFLQVLSNC